MKAISTFLLIIFILKSLIGQPMKGGINGTVQVNDGSGVGGVRVFLHHNVLQQYTETNATGQYHFDCPNGIMDMSASIYFSFYKPGYESQWDYRLPNDSKPVILTKSKEPVGYVQVRESGSAKFLGGILVAIQGNPGIVSDPFGYVKISLSPDFTQDQKIRISVDGNFKYKNEILDVTKSELLGQIIDISLKPITIKYQDLVKNLEEAHSKITKDHSEETQNKFINLFDVINGMPLSSRDQQQWYIVKFKYQPTYDYLQTGRVKQLSDLVTKRKRLFDLFFQKETETLQMTDGKKIFRQYDALFNLGLDVIRLDIQIYQLNEDESRLLGDIEFLQQFLEREKQKLEDLEGKINSQYLNDRRNELLKKADRLVNSLQQH